MGIFHEIGYSMPVDNNSGFICWKRLLRLFSEISSSGNIWILFQMNRSLAFWTSERITGFSLWLQSTYPEIELASLMIEPSPSCTRSLKKIINQKKLGGRFSYLQGAIGSLVPKELHFTIDPTWPAQDSHPLNQKKIQVKYLSEKVIMKKLEHLMT